MVGLMGGFQVPPGNAVSPLPLYLEGNGFLAPVINGRRDCIHGHDVAHLKGGGIPAEKYPIRTLALEILVRATWFLNVEMYSTRKGEYKLFFVFFCMHLVITRKWHFQ